jgi:gamma-glutamyltranspeptidase/glutathione hydrolase
LLYQKYGSKKVSWADLIAPAVKLADEGYILDEALPTTIAEGKDAFAKYPRPRRSICLAARCRRPAIGSSIRITPRRCARSPRTARMRSIRGSIARRIADDMTANGGVISFEDLAQYRAMEAQADLGRFHGNLVYSVPAPVSTGLQIVETLQILDNYVPRAGATVREQRGLPALRDRGVARARRRRAESLTRAVARRSGQPPRARAHAGALQTD